MKKIVILISVVLLASSNEASAQASVGSLVKDSTTAWFSLADSSMYTGSYLVESGEVSKVKVVVKDSVLYFYAGEYEGELIPSAKDSFLALGQVIIKFVRDADNKVSGFRADTGSTIITGKKEKPAELPKQ